ncbi:MAG TPA: 3-dehydroquinate synthase family protein [Methylophilaceae bacterium]|jgi:3-dehydroquinate synthase
MSVSFEIISSIKSYQVDICDNLVNSNGYHPEQKFVLIDQLVLDLYPYLKSDRLITIPAIEESKSLETVAYVIETLRSLGANRNSHLIALGGGIVQDIATFVSSVFMRGISWSYYPTTLLGMVDSCVGGKSSINVGQYKNIAGNFYPPDKIVVATEFCRTLKNVEVIAGLCEAVKICFAHQGSQFDAFLELTNQEGIVPEASLSKMVELTLLTKKKFIEEDEFDTGVRLLLNFGHTFGHAIEAAGNFSITHGVAVGLGMQMAIQVAYTFSPEVKNNKRVSLLSTYLEKLLRNVPELVGSLKAISSKDMLTKFQSDKKHTSTDYVVIIPDTNGFLVKKHIVKGSEFEALVVNLFEVIKGTYEV